MAIEVLRPAAHVSLVPDESAEPSTDLDTLDVPLVIVMTRNVSTRMQLVRQLPVDTVLVLAPDQEAADRALHAGSPHIDADHVEMTPIACGGLVVDPLTHRITWLGAQLPLTRLERRLLACLMEPPLRVWPYELLYRTVWRQAWLGDTSTVHAIVKRLRRRLRDNGVTAVLESVRGVGFSLVLQPAEIAGGYRPETSSVVRPVLPAPRHNSSSRKAASRAAAKPSWKRVTTP